MFRVKDEHRNQKMKEGTMTVMMIITDHRRKDNTERSEQIKIETSDNLKM